MIFLDSANLDDVRQAMALGFVAGVTTNPTIIARERRPASELIPELLQVCRGIVFHQLSYVRHLQNPLLEKATFVDASRPEPSSNSSNGAAAPAGQVTISN